MSAQCGYAFARFVLDVDRGTLLADGQEVRLRPKSFEVLRYLVAHHGRLIGKGELHQAAWPGAVVTDDSLIQCIGEIRRALGDTDRQAVRTVPRRGYVFELPVTPLEPHRERPDQGPVPGRKAPTGNARRRAARLTGAALGVAVTVLVAAWFAALRQVDPPPGNPAADAGPPYTIAVLPFEDMSESQDQEYFGDGIAEEILNLLAQSPELKVVARTSSFSFKGQVVDIPTIAARLGVQHVLEGSVRKAGNRVRVTAQLARAGDSAHVWSHTYDRDADDVLWVQADIAAAVANVLKATLLDPGRLGQNKRRDVAAYEHFLRARFLFNRRGPGDLQRSRELFEAALAIDPEYAPAWAGLSGVYNAQLAEGGVSFATGIARRREAAERALALDANLPEAHLRVAAVRAHDGELEQARHHMNTAQALDPDNPLLLGFLSGLALADGRIEDAVELAGRTTALDPLSAVTRMNFGVILLAAGRYQAARAQFEVTRELNMESADVTTALIAQALLLEGRVDQAMSLLRAPAGDSRERDLALAAAGGLLGEEQASAAIARLQAAAGGDEALALASAYAWRNETAAAFTWLEEARARFVRDSAGRGQHRWRQLAFASPFLQRLHGDPRWAAMFEG